MNDQDILNIADGLSEDLSQNNGWHEIPVHIPHEKMQKIADHALEDLLTEVAKAVNTRINRKIDPNMMPYLERAERPTNFSEIPSRIPILASPKSPKHKLHYNLGIDIGNGSDYSAINVVPIGHRNNHMFIPTTQQPKVENKPISESAVPVKNVSFGHTRRELSL